MSYFIVMIINLINLITWAIIVLVFVQVVLSYFLSPYHSIRLFINRIVDPLLSPIRKRIPPMGMFDFSPLILIILVQIAASLLTRLLTMLL